MDAGGGRGIDASRVTLQNWVAHRQSELLAEMAALGLDAVIAVYARAGNIPVQKFAIHAPTSEVARQLVNGMKDATAQALRELSPIVAPPASLLVPKVVVK